MRGRVMEAIAAAVLAWAQPHAHAQAGVARVYGDPEHGRLDYATYCAPCHGSTGGGDGPLAAMLTPRPVRHDDARYMARLSDAYVMRLLKEGGPALGKSPLMGKWGRRLTDDQLRGVVTYMRTLRR